MNVFTFATVLSLVVLAPMVQANPSGGAVYSGDIDLTNIDMSGLEAVEHNYSFKINEFRYGMQIKHPFEVQQSSPTGNGPFWNNERIYVFYFHHNPFINKKRNTLRIRDTTFWSVVAATIGAVIVIRLGIRTRRFYQNPRSASV